MPNNASLFLKSCKNRQVLRAAGSSDPFLTTCTYCYKTFSICTNLVPI